MRSRQLSSTSKRLGFHINDLRQCWSQVGALVAEITRHHFFSLIIHLIPSFNPISCSVKQEQENFLLTLVFVDKPFVYKAVVTWSYRGPSSRVCSDSHPSDVFLWCASFQSQDACPLLNWSDNFCWLLKHRSISTFCFKNLLKQSLLFNHLWILLGNVSCMWAWVKEAFSPGPYWRASLWTCCSSCIFVWALITEEHWLTIRLEKEITWNRQRKNSSLILYT